MTEGERSLLETCRHVLEVLENNSGGGVCDFCGTDEDDGDCFGHDHSPSCIVVRLRLAIAAAAPKPTPKRGGRKS